MCFGYSQFSVLKKIGRVRDFFVALYAIRNAFLTSGISLQSGVHMSFHLIEEKREVFAGIAPFSRRFDQHREVFETR
jgi:hypothetical protein